jgi:hypothetical protein
MDQYGSIWLKAGIVQQRLVKFFFEFLDLVTDIQTDRQTDRRLTDK